MQSWATLFRYLFNLNGLWFLINRKKELFHLLAFSRRSFFQLHYKFLYNPLFIICTLIAACIPVIKTVNRIFFNFMGLTSFAAIFLSIVTAATFQRLKYNFLKRKMIKFLFIVLVVVLRYRRLLPLINCNQKQFANRWQTIELKNHFRFLAKTNLFD